MAAAVDTASVQGLGGLSVGLLAEATGFSKSGLFGHFGSKQRLQLATIEAARKRFTVAVVQQATSAGSGIGRAWTLCSHWLAYAENAVFPADASSPRLRSSSLAAPERFVIAWPRSWPSGPEHCARRSRRLSS